MAEGTPDELTRRLQGYETVLVTAEGPEGDIKSKLERIAGVNLVEHRDLIQPQVEGESRVTFEVHAEKGNDVRAELARAVVESSWKLYELKTSGMSLEDIFLKLTHEDKAIAEHRPAAEAAAASQAT